MDRLARTTEFFKAGGTLHPDAPSYIKRPADDDLYARLLSGQFCYILTSRQRGKSSLMIRTAERLRQEKIKTAIVDLSGVGTQVSPEQWYLGIIKRLAVDLELAVDPAQWWSERSALSPVQRFTDFLHEVALGEIAGRIVIFIDEIDSTLKLDFADDFFAAIRLTYNLRATEPAYDRLTFVLLGVATPTDLIKDRKRTPFNIGQPIDLPEFCRSDARPLEEGLNQRYPGQGKAILDRIFEWTSGHPYLTQRLCVEIAGAPDVDWQTAEVDQVVNELFLSDDALTESNLQFVRSNVEASSNRRALLQLYRRIYQGERVAEDKHSPLQERLRLIGLVRADNGLLRTHNEIYRRVFDLAWIKEKTPRNTTQIVMIGAAAVIVLAFLAAFLLLRSQQQEATAVKIKTYSDNFLDSSDSDVKITYLRGICQIEADGAARRLFFDQQSQQQRLELFKEMDASKAGANLSVVIGCLRPALEQKIVDDGERQALLGEICRAVCRSDRKDDQQLQQQVGGDCTCGAGP